MNSPDSIHGMRDPDEVMTNTVSYVEAFINWATQEPDALERDMVAHSEVEDQNDSFHYPVPSSIIGDILQLDTGNPTNPVLVLGNVVHFTESADKVRTVISTSDIEHVPLRCISEPLLTQHLRYGSCSGDSWHKDYFPTTDV